MSTMTMTRTTGTTGTTTGTVRTVRAAAVPRPARSAGAVRLTRRGRWVLTLLILGAILGLSLVVSSGSVASGERGAAPATETIVVDQGDTLWGIASQAGGPGETRDVMYEIEQLNHLDSSTLVEGQTLVVPAS